MTLVSSTSSTGLPQVPLHAPLSAKYKDTFAYPTIKDRCPVILCKVIDHLHRQRNNIARYTEYRVLSKGNFNKFCFSRDHGQDAGEGLYKVVEELSKLRYEMLTDKPITAITDEAGNAQVWNDYLEQQRKLEERPSWFTSCWMWVECYMYRRMLQSLNLTQVPYLK